MFSYPIGTKVILIAPVVLDGQALEPGLIGKITSDERAAEDVYRVCLSNDAELDLHLNEFKVLAEFQRATIGTGERSYEFSEWEPFIEFRCVVGSRAYGLEMEGSDTDVRGFYLPPADRHWSLGGVPDQLVDDERQECFWEFQKFLELALKANPNVLECLNSPMVLQCGPVAARVMENRPAFLSKMVFQTYSHYVMSQFHRMKKRMEKHGDPNWKHAMHLIRLLYSGTELLKDGIVHVNVDEIRKPLLEIKRGEWSFDQVNEWRIRLQKEFEHEFSRTSLPDQPDVETVNKILVWGRRKMAEVKG